MSVPMPTPRTIAADINKTATKKESINQTRFNDSQKKDFTTINNSRIGIDDEPEDTSTKGILKQADKLGLK